MVKGNLVSVVTENDSGFAGQKGKTKIKIGGNEMKVKMTIILAAIALISFGLYGTGYAFHDGGVARCEACHTMHNSLNNGAMNTDGSQVQFQAGPYLLQGSDPSSACLNCHESSSQGSYTVSTSGVTYGGTLPTQMTPGGDFSWIKTTSASVGEKYGHNIIAADNGYVADSRTGMATAPGGTYPNNKLYCSSCHDPHGKYRRLSDGSIVNGKTTSLPIEDGGSYATSPDPSATAAVGVFRLLAGVGYEPKSNPGFAFTANAPAAVAPSTYNRNESTSDTRVSYGSGMSEWCKNCHTSIHNDSYTSGQTGAGTIHPAGNGADLGATIAANYNAYISSGNLSGDGTAAYTSLVPFELGTSDYAVLKPLAVNDGTQKGGPTSLSNVMCLSCHRAHASGFASMVRYDLSDAMFTDAGTYSVRSGRTTAEITRAYNDRPATNFGNYQRVLCNKCHVKD